MGARAAVAMVGVMIMIVVTGPPRRPIRGVCQGSGVAALTP